MGHVFICDGVEIDNLIHVAHNVIIGENSAVIALYMIGGSTSIGRKAWIAPCTCLRDDLGIGESATVGMGAVVVRDVQEKETVFGVPAKRKDNK